MLELIYIWSCNTYGIVQSVNFRDLKYNTFKKGSSMLTDAPHTYYAISNSQNYR